MVAKARLVAVDESLHGAHVEDAAVGHALAEMHEAAKGFELTRRNALSVGGWIRKS